MIWLAELAGKALAMLLAVFVKGLLMGLAIAAPVGPIALLCIRRTLAHGRWAGFVSGLGAATADGFYGAIAAFGLTAFSNLLTQHTSTLTLVGGLFLCYLGLKTFWASSSVIASFDLPQISDNSEHNKSEQNVLTISVLKSESSKSLPFVQTYSLRSSLTSYTTTLALTLTNPATILSFIAIFAGLGITQSERLTSVTLVFGVFTGSVLWWLVLVSGVAQLQSRLNASRLNQFNRLASRVFGVLIFGFGVGAIFS